MAIFFAYFFLGVFKWFCLHKKVSLTTLAASGRPPGVTHGLSRAQGGLENCLFLANFGQFRGIWCKDTFFPFFWPQKSFIKLFLNSLVVTKKHLMHTLEPTEGPCGVRSGPRRPQTGPQNLSRPKLPRVVGTNGTRTHASTACSGKGSVEALVRIW